MYGTLDKNEAALSSRKLDGAAKQAGIKSSMFKICIFICGLEFCERLAFYTFYGTQVFFLERLQLSMIHASHVQAAMGTLSFLLTLFGGWLADVGLGRYRTIVVSMMIYAAASAMIVASAHPNIKALGDTVAMMLYLIGTVALVPLATAGMKCCISVFGADQFDSSTPDGAAAAERFFNWFFVSINAGAVFVFVFLVNFGNRGGLGVKQEYAYFAAYLIAAVCIFAGLVLFVSGRSSYVITPPPRQGSSLVRILTHIWQAARRGSYEAVMVLAGFIAIILGPVLSVIQGLAGNHAETYISACMSVFGIITVFVFCRNPDWVGDPTIISGRISSPRAVCDTKGLLCLIPVLFTGEIAGQMAQTVMSVWFQNQACQMDLRMPGSTGQLSGASFNVADCAIIVIATPLLLNYGNPWLERRLGRKLHYSLKIYIGIGFGILAILSAAIIEIFRRNAPGVGIESSCAPHGVQMKGISAFWICIPYILTAIGEIYVVPTILSLAYDRSPDSMRTFFFVVYYIVASMISAIVSLTTAVLGSYVTDDLDKGHLEYVYAANIGVTIVLAILFYKADTTFEVRSQSARGLSERAMSDNSL